MARKVNLNLLGKPAEFEELEFEIVREGWSEYKLEDGTRLAVRFAVTRVLCATGEKDQITGDPIYFVMSSNAIKVLHQD